ncbi:MAG: amidohydrolase family protein [Acidimicrobiales bacterium]
MSGEPPYDQNDGGVLAGLPLVDAHCHPLLARAVGPDEFERCCTEADRTSPGTSAWDTPVGLAIRRWCPPLLDLAPLAAPADYLARRDALGLTAVTSRLLGAAGLSHLLVDTGVGGAELADPATLGPPAGARVFEVVRLERVAEELAATGVAPGDFAAAYAERLDAACRDAAAVKSVVAYRHGLDIDPDRPGPAEVRTAAEEWFDRPGTRLDHPVLLRFVLWAGVDLGLPLQVHTCFGDRDVRLERGDPLLLQPFLDAVEPTEVPVVLLHCYPFHRKAGWLATVYPHVYLDVGLTVGQIGAAAGSFLSECLELTPFAKVLFSTDGYRLPELYLVGAAQFRHSLGRLLDRRVREGDMSGDDAERLATMVAAGNARRVYTRI